MKCEHLLWLVVHYFLVHFWQQGSCKHPHLCRVQLLKPYFLIFFNVLIMHYFFCWVDFVLMYIFFALIDRPSVDRATKTNTTEADPFPGAICVTSTSSFVGTSYC